MPRPPSPNQSTSEQKFLSLGAGVSFSCGFSSQLSPPLASSSFSSQTKSRINTHTLGFQKTQTQFKIQAVVTASATMGNNLLNELQKKRLAFLHLIQRFQGKAHTSHSKTFGTSPDAAWGVVLVFSPKWFMRVCNFVHILQMQKGSGRLSFLQSLTPSRSRPLCGCGHEKPQITGVIAPSCSGHAQYLVLGWHSFLLPSGTTRNQQLTRSSASLNRSQPGFRSCPPNHKLELFWRPCEVALTPRQYICI